MVYSIPISINEQRLLEAIQEVKFGELYGVEVLDAPKEIITKVKDSNVKLLELIREGNPLVDTITIHDGEAVSAIIVGMRHGWGYRKKVKLTS